MDEVFKALADPTRRALLDSLLANGGQTMSELTADLGMRRQSAAKHLRILESAGLVSCRWAGREKRHYLNPVPIAQIGHRWIDKFSVDKTAAVLRLKHRLEEEKSE
jgi:DNA-binding transcriptional ArsR family regulator